MLEPDKTQPLRRRSLVEEYPELIDPRHVSLLVAAIWAIVIGASIMIALMIGTLEAQYRWRMFFPAAIVLLSATALVVLRQRGVIAAMRLLAIAGWILTTVTGFGTEGVRAPVLLAYPMIVIFTGWTLGARAGVALFAASCIAIMAMAVAQSMNLAGHAPPLPPVTMALAHLIVLSISIAMTLYLLRSFRESYARYRLLTENIKDVVWIVDVDTLRYSYISPSVHGLRGFTQDEVLAQPLTHALTPEERERLEKIISNRARLATSNDDPQKKYFTDEIEQIRRDGSTVWTEVISSFHCNAETGRIEMRGITRDISDRKHMELELRRLATTDPLTGIPNRRHFMQQLELELARVQRLTGQCAVVLMLDLDHFKRVNDRYGHATGDALLKHFVSLMLQEIRQIDSAGRVGGEEFAIILPGADLAAARLFADRLRVTVARTSLVQDGNTIPITVSIGIAALTGTDANETLRRADEALYRAKKAGRNRVEVAGDETVPA